MSTKIRYIKNLFDAVMYVNLILYFIVSKEWEKKITHDCIWKPICQEYGIITTETVTDYDQTKPNYFNTFKQNLTLAKNWTLFQSKRYELHCNKGPILSLLIAHLTRVFSGDIDGTIHVWNAQSNQYVASIRAHEKHVSCLTHHKNMLASGSSDTTIVIHNITTLERTNILQGHEGPVTSLVFAPTTTTTTSTTSTTTNATMKNNKEEVFLISGSTDRTIRIWDTTKNTCIRILHGQENTIISLAYCTSVPLMYCQAEPDFSPVRTNTAGYIISGSSDRNIFVWDLKKSVQDDAPQVINTIMGTNGPVTAMAVYDESEAMATTNLLQSTNPKTSEFHCARKPINIPPFIIYAGLTDATVSLYSIPGLEKTYIETPNVHRGTIWSITAATLHSKIITTSGDRTAMVWDLKSPKKCTTLGGFDSAVVASTVSSQEEILCFGTERGTIVVFDLREFH